MSNSLFSLTGRDRFLRPYKGSGSAGTPTTLDAGFVINAQDGLSAVESYTQDAVRLEKGSARANGLSFAVQRWLAAYDGTQPYGGPDSAPNLLLALSPAFLEDCGVVAAQGVDPSTPRSSLASSVGTSVPPFTAGPDLPGVQALGNPQPSWCARLPSLPLLRFSVRQVGATGDQVLSAGRPAFFDAGSGTSPFALVPVRYALPSLWQQAVPAGSYEVCLLAVNWGS